MPREPQLRTLVAALCVAIGVAGCGSSGGGADGTATEPPPPATSAAGATTAAAPATAAPTTSTAGAFTLSSPAFADNGAIPRRFTCQGDSVSPELDWTGVPAGTSTLALVVVDPDAPIDNGFTHWVLTDIDPAAGKLAEGTTAGTAGDSSRGGPGYTGPCPPSGTHHYVFTLYALASPPAAATREAIEAAAAKALGKAVLTGTYQQT
jgi:Raf kinase inhibitor-like YbhB/YbcL family protein